MSNAANWTAAPVPGDDLIFDGSQANTTSSSAWSDLGFSIRSITFTDFQTNGGQNLVVLNM